MSTRNQTERGTRLRAELEQRGNHVRPASVVMQPAMLGAARLTRYSFSRTMLRRAVTDGWQARRTHFDMNAAGEGEATYEVDTGTRTFSFVAFTTTLSEDEHTDRVIADEWEITAALIDGEVTPADVASLRSEIPRQEDARLTPRVLVLGRGNRSVRFFQYLVDCLAAGHQPDADRVGDAGYIMRSTAFYANGKFGMRSFDGYAEDHELAVPYRAQLIAAWLFRELSYDVVEHCAVAQGGSTAVGFDAEWRRYFGLGNATGLGLVPYALKHPAVINSWVAIRELALADVRALDATPERLAVLDRWADRALTHFSTGTSDDCTPFHNPATLVEALQRIRSALDTARPHADAFDRLYRWAEGDDPETLEFVVSLLIELHDGDDRLFDELLTVDEHRALDPGATVGATQALIDRRFSWIDALQGELDSADRLWWVISDNTEEPRRTPHSLLEPNGRDLAIDVAARVLCLRAALAQHAAALTVAEFLAEHPEHRLAVERVHASDDPYGEPRDDVCAATFLPLQLQRFQLAMYGMDNFKPKSTDWLRVTLYQGAPRLADLAASPADDWVLPPRPRSRAQPGPAPRTRSATA